MTKLLITLIIVAAAAYVFHALTPDDRRAIGDPVLSVEPTASASLESVASPSLGAL